MGLTWTPGSVNLRGVGGVSSKDGTTHQQVRIRLGGCTEEDGTPSPYEGCLSVLCHPVVCSPEFTQSVKADVILGQGFIRPCLGLMDSGSERFSYAPAYMRHGCKNFRVSVPCTMSKPRPVPTQPPVAVAAPEPTAGVVTVEHQDPAAAHPGLSEMCDGPVSIITIQASLAPSADTAVAHLSPGFHAEGVPTREEHERQRRENAERNAADRREAESIRASQQALISSLKPKTLKPIGYVYSAEQVDRLNRSQPGGLLDLSGPTANEAIETERIASRVRAECTEEFSGRVRTVEAALAKVSRELAQLRSTRTPAQQPPPAQSPAAAPAPGVQPSTTESPEPSSAPAAAEAINERQPQAAPGNGIQTRAQRRASGTGTTVASIGEPTRAMPLSQLLGKPATPATHTVATAAIYSSDMPALDIQDDYA